MIFRMPAGCLRALYRIRGDIMNRSAIALLATTLSAAFAQTAFAADLPHAPAPAYRAPIAVPVYSWSGVYIGINLGGAAGRSNTPTTTVFSPVGYFADTSIPAVNAVGAQTVN